MMSNGKTKVDLFIELARPDDKGNQIWQAGCSEPDTGSTASVLGYSEKEAIQNRNRRIKND